MKSAGGGTNWQIVDSMRGFTTDSATAELLANTFGAEGSNADPDPIATGFRLAGKGASQTFIYLAIRRPNKPPTTGTQVYNAIARTGTGAAATVTGVGFAPDLYFNTMKSPSVGWNKSWWDRLRGRNRRLQSNGAVAEFAYTDAVMSFDQAGVTLEADSNLDVNGSGYSYINYFFRRAPGVFDVVCWTGTGNTNLRLAHSLGAAPELAIVKQRNGSAQDWNVYVASEGINKRLILNTTAASTTQSAMWGTAIPTATDIGINEGFCVANTQTVVAYLFATKAGISKVGSYTGNGSSQTINCGFTTGARFILIKRTDNTGDWFTFDTVRGIVDANDPHLSLNTTAAEVTSNDSVDPVASGFIVNQNGTTNLNVNAATYIFLSIA
jgi:hypothetical protein